MTQTRTYPIGTEVEVYFPGDAGRTQRGRVRRSDAAALVVELFDGRFVLGSECQVRAISFDQATLRMGDPGSMLGSKEARAASAQTRTSAIVEAAEALHSHLTDDHGGETTEASRLGENALTFLSCLGAALARPEPAWTKECPTVPGLYFARASFFNDRPFVCTVKAMRVIPHGIPDWDGTDVHRSDVAAEHWEWWSEPLPEPPR